MTDDANVRKQPLRTEPGSEQEPPSKKRSLDHPTALAPIPAAAPSEEPQVDEVVEDDGEKDSGS